MAKPVDLLASYWTLATGCTPHSDREFSTAKFNVRVACAARAGFTGFGIRYADLDYTLRTQSLEDTSRVLEDHGMRHVELEFLLDWWVTDGEKKAACDSRKRFLFEAAAALGARHVKVGDFSNTPCPMPQLIESFARLCAEAREYGTAILFEPMPFSYVHSLEGALELVAGADAPNGGIVFDLWHVVKLGIPYADVARVPKRFLRGIELNDGTFSAPWDLVEDTLNHRRLCGEGEFDVKGFVKTMLEAGYDGPWGVEVLNREMRTWPADVLARRASATTRAQFPDSPVARSSAPLW
jgi:sugar phosphate isomerase/epimerase